ncbi:MAG: hypothetical protein MZU95_01610 [Desulfomicrobium escambiense]|nr:hypothetical protein [Desulfomicrobium escambiense]
MAKLVPSGTPVARGRSAATTFRLRRRRGRLRRASWACSRRDWPRSSAAPRSPARSRPCSSPRPAGPGHPVRLVALFAPRPGPSGRRSISAWPRRSSAWACGRINVPGVAGGRRC